MVELKLTGEEELRKAFGSLPKKLQRDVALASLVRATMPTVEVMKAIAPVDTGALRQSIGYRLRSYSAGKLLFMAIGPRRGQFGPNNEQPSRTVHAVENGHWAGKGKNRTFVAPNAFMRRSWDMTKDATLAAFKANFGEGLKVEVVKHASRRKKTK